ncbi:MAG: CHAD domain-containing protein [Ignavibacteriae bacterium]|nr:CHAD domain-containing protein [Ignavibacteriota bacterium]
MAKAFEIEGFDVNNSLTDCLHLLFKSKTEELYFHYDQLFGNNDIEILHNTRVSSRRLIALFKVFRPLFPQKKYLKIYQPLYDFKNLLGPVRENDVLLKMIGEYISGFIQKDIKAVMLFFAKLKNDNITARAKLYKNSELKAFKNHREKLLKFYDKYLLNPKKNIDILDINLNFKENAALILPILFERVNRYIDSVNNHPRNKIELHRMRIKAKPQRYTMELYLKAFGQDFEKCYEEIKLFVEKTGDIHDIDVISEHVTSYLKELRIYNDTQKGKKEKISTKSLREYLKFLKERRIVHFKEVCELLNKWEAEDYKVLLENSISGILQPQVLEISDNIHDI